MDTEKLALLQSTLKRFVRLAMFDAEKSHKLISADNELAGIAYANKACAKISAAEAFYYTNIEHLEHTDIEKVFTQFDEFCDEILSAFSEGSAHQWTGIEFERLKELFDDSVCAFGND